MQIFVACQGRHLVEFAQDATVENVKQFVAATEGVSPADMFVMCKGHVMECGLLSANGVSELSVVEVGVRVLGGKVHGSLARAGKVKGQTPKVAPQEKKKKKTGRCKRRIQYTKRFVNVVLGPGGKRRGPNSNADKVGI
eukprot:m.220972 g.220972  ORF g.220972 m.220972 type:complete len:139 (+) comp15686_c0_seq1:39-455(+)